MVGRPAKHGVPCVKATHSFDPAILAAVDSIARLTETSRSEVLNALLRSKHLVGHVHQTCHKSCGIAVAAMLASKSFSDVHPLSANDCTTRGLSQREMLSLLDSATGAHWVKRLRQLTDVPSGRWCFLIREDGQDYGHWVALLDGVVHDPDCWNGCPVALYPRRDWTVIMSACQAD